MTEVHDCNRQSSGLGVGLVFLLSMASRMKSLTEISSKVWQPRCPHSGWRGAISA